MQSLVLNAETLKALLEDKMNCFFAPVLPPFSVAYAGNKSHLVIRNNMAPEGQYKVGELLYIKEPWRILFVSQIGGTKVEYMTGGIQTIPEVIAPNHNAWEPAELMPESAARQFIQITDVTIKRLQDVTVKEILASGLDVELPNICKQSLDPNWPANEIQEKYAELSPKQQNEYLQSYSRATYTGWCEYASKLHDAFSQQWNLSIPPERIDMYRYQANPFIYHVKFEKRSLEEARQIMKNGD